jgi:hypothetical protein
MKQSTREDLAKAETLLAKIEALPVSIEARKAEQAATLAKRTEAAAKIEALREEAAIIPKLREAVDAVDAELKAHHDARKVIEEKKRIALLTLMEERGRIEMEIHAAESVLLSNYDPRIDEAIAFFCAKREVLFQKEPTTQTQTGEKNIYTERRRLHVFSNQPAIAKALAFCLDAIHRLEAMRFEPALDGEQLASLKTHIPDVNAETERVGSIYAGDTPPAIAHPSRMDNILAEAKRILGY